jgi:hypothetical protein
MYILKISPSIPTSIYWKQSASIQPRTSFLKFGCDSIHFSFASLLPVTWSLPPAPPPTLSTSSARAQQAKMAWRTRCRGFESARENGVAFFDVEAVTLEDVLLQPRFYIWYLKKSKKITLSLHLSFQWPFSYFHFRITFRSRFFPHSFCRVNILPRPFHTLQYKAVFFVATSYRIVQAKMQYCLASIRTAPEVVL